MVILFVLVTLAPAIFGQAFYAVADEPETELTELVPEVAGTEIARPEISGSEVAGSDVSEPMERMDALGKRLPDGRLLRAIGIPDSQKFELIPPNYSPVKQDQLIDAIGRWSESTVETPSNRLRKAEYVVRVSRDLFTCRRGYLDVTSDQRGWVSQSLGKASFAILDYDLHDEDDQTVPGHAVQGRLVSLADGTLIARFKSESKRLNRIPLKWESRGVAGPRGYSFELDFPRALQTRFLFCVDEGVQLESDNGVLRALDGVPDSIVSSDADPLENDASLRWYELDAGGLDAIRVRSIGQQSDVSAEAIIVRRNAVEYDIDSSGLYFIQRMELVLPVGVSLPQLRVIGARLTSIKVNASEASFVQLWSDAVSSSDDGLFSTDYRAISPPGAIRRKETRVTLTLMGQADWGDVCNLPLAGIVANSDGYNNALRIPVVDACVSDEARVTMAPVGRIVDWELPSGWQRQSAAGANGMNIETAGGTSLYAAFKSAVATGKSHLTSQSKRAAPKYWSRLRLSRPPVFQVRDLWLRSEIGEAGINCVASFELLLSDRGIEPLRFLIQEGWEIDSVVFPSSARVIETPQVDDRLRLLTVWPELEDIDQTPADDEATDSFGLRIQINGKRAVRSSGARMMVPATWMVRACDHHARKILSDDFTAAVIPPPDMNWAADTAMMPHRVDRDQLLQGQRSFFDGQDRTTLFLKPRHRQIDVLGLESPSVDYQASLSLQISKRGDEMVEQCFIKVSSLGRGLEELVIHTGPAVSRPALRWMIPGQKGALSTTLAASNIDLSDINGEGIYTINIAGLDLASRPLIAYRSYPAKDVSMQLPSIPSAVSGTSKLYIGTGLQIASKSKGVQLVPRSSSPVGEEPFDGLHLRYDAVQKPSIKLAVSDRDVSMNLITHSQTKVVASSRGSDRVKTRISAALSIPLTIQYDPELQLASVTRDGKPIDMTMLSKLPLVLPPRAGKHHGKPEVIGLEWNRNQVGFHTFRRCRMPRLGFDATVLKQEYHLVASADTFAPRSLLTGNSESTRYRMVEMLPGESMFLIRRNVMLAVGWLIAMVNFIVFWLVMKRSPISMLVCLAVFSVSVLLWWPWRMTIIGWFIVPLIAAAMLVAARSWVCAVSESSSKEDASQGNGPIRGGDLPQTEPTTDFSWESMLRGWVIAFAVISPASPGSIFQESNLQAQSNPAGVNSDVNFQTNTTRREVAAESGPPVVAPVNVIIPMDSGNRSVGEFVYVPDAFHRQLFDNQAQASLQLPAFASAKYELKIRENDTSGQEFVAASLVATFEVEFPRQWNDDNELRPSKAITQCLIPLSFERIEKIQLLGTEPTTLRFSPGPQGGTVVSLTNSETAQIQITLRLIGSRQGPWVRFELGVPSVSASRIEVESEVDLRVLRVGGVTGRLIEEADLRRWSEVLGPTEQLDVSFRIDPRLDPAAAKNVKPLQRRYWVSSGLNATTIDCEVDPPEAFAAGEVFQFVIRDLAMPILMSPDWRLVDTSVYAARRRRVSVMSVRDSPGPIQLLWNLSNQDEWASSPDLYGDMLALSTSRTTEDVTSNAVGISGDDSVPIRIPEVIASSLGENAPAWIALRCLDSLSFDPLPGGLIEPLSVDQFLAGWSGYRGRIDRAFVALDEIPSPQLRRSSLGSSQIEDRHRLRVSPRRLELSYQAEVTPDAGVYQPYLLSVPNGIDLVDLYVDEIRQLPFFVDSGGRRHVLIERKDRLSESFKVSAFAIGELSPGEPFKPPVMVLSHSSVPQSTPSDQVVADTMMPSYDQNRVSSYTVSRTNDSFIQIVEPFAVEATRSVATLTADSLADGYLPVATWKASSSKPGNVGFLATSAEGENAGQNDDPASVGSDPSVLDDFWQGNWGGVFRVQQRTDRFNCDQLITLKRLDRDWQVSNQIHFPGQRRPDYIDIEIPTRWCESLEISPTTAWSRQPSTNALHQIVRVRCDPAQFQDQPLVVTGLLSQIDDGRVSVPTIRVLGLGKRNVFVQVPKRLTSELVQWRRVGVEETPLPRYFADSDIEGDSANQDSEVEDSAAEDSAGAYRVTRRRWSIDLAPLPELSLQPIATAQDNQVFPADDAFCVISHWDVSPGSLEKLMVAVPADAECLGAWSGGVTVPVVNRNSLSVPSTDDVGAVAGEQQVLEIPLSLSQLPQSVKLLIRVPATRFKRADYVPHLVDIPVTQAWLAIYQAQSLGDRAEAKLSTEITKLRNLSLARSVVESIELAVDIVAERSSDEVVPWLAPWVYRYLQLAAASGRTAEFSQAATEDPKADPAELLSHSIERFDEVQWQLLDRRIAVYANRFVPGLQAQFGGLVGGQTSDTDDSDTPSGSESVGSEIEYQRFLGDEAIISSTSVPGFRLGQVVRLASPALAPPLGAASGTDHRLRRMLRNAITLILVVGLLACLKPLKRFAQPLIIHPAFWLAALGVAGLFVAPSYVALSLILVAISMPWFPSGHKSRHTA